MIMRLDGCPVLPTVEVAMGAVALRQPAEQRIVPSDAQQTAADT